MLTKFSVENFKAFPGKLTLDLGRSGNYEFNTEVIRNGVVDKAVLYGFNGSGKSALGLALFDITIHLTDWTWIRESYEPYHNLDNPAGQPVAFAYSFLFDGTEVVYRYEKSDAETLLSETLLIGGREVLRYDFLTHAGYVGLEGAETLDLAAEDSQISRVKYVRRNGILRANRETEAFKSFIDFVDRMLLFYSLDKNKYQGFKGGSDSVGASIIKAGKTKEFEAFLQENNIRIRLEEKDVDGEKKLVARYQNRDFPFFRIISTGTKALTIFYYWYIKMEEASFVFMDEFDAFYHFELAESVVKTVRRLPGTQVILTTHNTDLLSNDLLRPDCFFWLDEGRISPLCDLTEKELRRAHNLQKMFKAGAFRG
ncbi:MAG: ATP-binding protein [Oscillospiraceae bacterium]|nr:ATP-binding protein [Oscillospiraceae bacterium]